MKKFLVLVIVTLLCGNSYAQTGASSVRKSATTTAAAKVADSEAKAKEGKELQENKQREKENKNRERLLKLQKEEKERITRETNKRKGKISGVITYNNGYNSRADIGSSVYIVKLTPEMEITYTEFNDSLRKARLTSDAESFYNRLLDRGASEADAIGSVEKMYGKGILVESKNNADKFAFEFFLNTTVVNKGIATECIVDGTGNYSADVANGRYCVIIKSNNIKKLSVSEISGALDVNFTTVENAETKLVNKEFK